VLTSKRFIEKKPVQLDAELVFLEDLKEKATTADKLGCAFSAFVTPCSWLDTKLGLRKVKPDDLLTVIFTSGSTGEPKGVMLSQHNISSNVEAVDHLFHLRRNDVIMGVLPFFHSFGYTVTMWLPFITEPAAVYHFNPLDGRTVGKLCGKYDVTILGATPTFLRTYLKRCTADQLSKLDLAIVGAEKLPTELAKSFKDKFGIEPTEGYGTTELSPIAAFNVPEHRMGPTDQVGAKMGSVGRPMPGAIARIVNVDTGEDLGTNIEGLLQIKGPNVMLGYLNQEEKTREVIQDGWYNTGDIARIDDDGFIEITGRQSRFSKIGGEMVPHIRIENELARIVDDPDDDEPNILVAVTSVPDPKKGERLIVFHKQFKKSIDDALDELSQTDLPNIWLPGRDSFHEVTEIPLLGTGKLNLKALKDLALEKYGP
jgi:acyl-[acyl-carrier-protein]-phospholipid O-acyltransferase/long-chain-fatty-acid--[acyl-carrier-protein] ligase